MGLILNGNVDLASRAIINGANGSTELIIDGYKLGPELITDAGDRYFSAGQGNWNIVAGNDITFDNVSMNWACDGETNTIRLTIPAITETTLYRVEFGMPAFTSGGFEAWIGNNFGGNIVEAVDTFVLYFTAGAGTFLQFRSPGNFIGKIDNVSLKECL